MEGKEVSHSELTSYLAQKPSSSFLGIRRPGAQLVLYDDSQVNTSSDNIINHLEYIGYYGSKVRSEVQYKRKRAYVTYYVTPGKRYTIRSIDFELPQDEEFRREFETDRPHITIKEGQYLAESTLEAETVRSAEFFRNRGYYGFDKSGTIPATGPRRKRSPTGSSPSATSPCPTRRKSPSGPPSWRN